jgi:transposase
VPLLLRRTACDRRDCQRDARSCARAASSHPHLPAALWLRACGTIHQAPAPERPIAKGLASPGLLAHVLVARYCDHPPLYRQCQIFARHGVDIDRSTLANWVGGACWCLEPLQARLAAHVFGSTKLFADDTPIPVLDPGRGRTKTGRLWVYARGRSTLVRARTAGRRLLLQS